jgi:hypothetical protein
VSATKLPEVTLLLQIQGLQSYQEGSEWEAARIYALLKSETANCNSKAGRSRPSVSPNVLSRNVLPEMNKIWYFKFNHSSTRCSHLRLCVLYRSRNKEQLMPYTALTDWFFITDVESVYLAERTESLYKTNVSLFKRVTFSSYRFNISPESDNQITCSQSDMLFKKLVYSQTPINRHPIQRLFHLAPTSV